MKSTVYLRKSDGRWVGSVSLGKDKKTGKRLRKYIYADTEKEAQRLINDIVYELQNGLYINESGISLENFLKEWIDIHSSKVESTTEAYYRLMLDKHIIPEIGKLKIKEIKPLNIDKFYKEKLKTLSGNSVLKLHCIINNALKYAKINGLIKTNPVEFIQPPKKSKHTPNIMNEENFTRLLLLVKGTFDEIPILLAGCLGLRRGEIFGLQWSDVDFKNKILSIKNTITRFDKYVTKKPKNNSSIRRLTIPDFVLDVLEKYKSSLKVIGLYICDKFKPQYYSEHFRSLLEKNGFDIVRFHDLRHFNAIIMMQYGIPDKIASGRLGHSNVATTREIYQHVIPDMDKQAAKIINDIFAAK
jgi:integrase